MKTILAVLLVLSLALLLGFSARPTAADTLVDAAKAGSTDTVIAMVRHGANVDMTDAEGWTPIMHAAKGGHLAVVQVLLSAGADLMRKAADGSNVQAVADGTEVAAAIAAVMAADEKAKAPVYVKIETNHGDIIVECNREKAPLSVANFLSYVESGYYEGTIFHRVIPGFMVQGGGFVEGMEKKDTGESIENEWENGLKNTKGTLAMARLGRQPNSATSQFFINVADNGFLDQPRDGAGYAVFAKVIGGMDVVEKIEGVETSTQGQMQNVPTTPVLIVKVSKIDKP